MLFYCGKARDVDELLEQCLSKLQLGGRYTRAEKHENEPIERSF